MKIRLSILVGLLATIFGFTFLVGCSNSTVEPTPTPTRTLEPTPTKIPTPTNTPTPSPADLVEQADGLLEKSDFKGAIETYERALAMDDANAHAYFGLIEALIATGLANKINQSVKIAEEAETSLPDNSVVQAALAKAYMANDQYEEALRAAELASELEPDDANIQAILAQAYLYNNQFDKSMSAIEKAIEIDDRLAYAYYVLGHLYKRTADFGRAGAAYERAIEIQPSFSNYLIASGILELELEDYANAVELFQQAVDISSDSIYGLFGLGQTELSRKEFDIASEIVEKIKKIEDTEPMAYILAGDIDTEQGYYEGALDKYMQATNHDEDNLLATSRMVDIYLLQDECNKASSLLQDLILKFPSDPELIVKRGWTKVCQDDLNGGLTQFRIAIKNDPYIESAYAGMGLVYTYQERWEDADEAFSNLLQTSSSPAIVHANLGDYFFQQGYWDLAEEEYRIAINLNPYLEGASISLGELLALLGRNQEAMHIITEGLELDPQNQDLRAVQGSLYYYAGELDKAQDILEGVLDENPDNETSILFLGLTLRDKKEFREARRYLDTFLILKCESSEPEQLLECEGLDPDKAVMLDLQSDMMSLGYLQDEEEAMEFMEEFGSFVLDRKPDISLEDREVVGRTILIEFRPGVVEDEEEALSQIAFLLTTASLQVPRIDPPVENGIEIQVIEGGITSLIINTPMDVLKLYADGLIGLEDVVAKSIFSIGEVSSKNPTIDQITRKVSELRELTPRERVPSNVIDPDDVRTDLIESIDAQVREDIQRDATVLTMMGVITDGVDLEETWVDLYDDQIVGYYDPEEKAFYYIEHEENSFLDDMTIAHEYVHALQDQNFDLLELGDKTLNSDQALALDALIEGDATLTMLLYAEQNISTADRLEAAATASGVETDEVDPMLDYLAELALFPYDAGLGFVISLYMSSEAWENVDAAYVEPPVSTEQILHPDLYIQGEKPLIVTVPTLDDELMIGWEQVDRDVMGEFGIRLWVSDHTGPGAGIIGAEGWGGDQYVLLYNSELDAHTLIFSSTWDDIAQADQFWGVWRALMNHRSGYNESFNDLPAMEAYRCWEGQKDTICAYQDGKDVHILVGQDDQFVKDSIQFLSGSRD